MDKRSKYGIYHSILNSEDTLKKLADKCMAEIMKRERICAMNVVPCLVLGPAITDFLAWMLIRAREQGIKRLYFLARDGYFMYMGASKLCTHYHIPIECRYLECSRFSLRLPAYHKNIEEALDFICRGGIDVTLRKILMRAGLTTEEVEIVGEQMEESTKLDEILNYSQIRKFAGKLRESELFMLLLDVHSKDAYENAVGYFIQEGMTEDIPYALVDSGWTGSMQYALQKLLQDKGVHRQIHGFYWGLYEIPVNARREDYEAYYFTPEHHLKRKADFSNCLFECIFSAPAGMTVRYGKGEKYYPVYGRVHGPNCEMINCVERYLNNYWDCFMENVENIDKIGNESCRKVISRLVKRFMSFPSYEEAELFGKLLFSDDILDGNVQKVAAPLSESELTDNHALRRIAIMSGHCSRKLKESAWYEGSAVLYGESKAKKHIMQYRLYKYLIYIRKWWKNI